MFSKRNPKSKNKMSKVHTFVTEAEIIEMTIDGKPYEIRELSGAERDKYLNRVAKRMQYSNDGTKVKSFNHEGHQADLISKTVFDKAGENPKPADIAGWPSKVQTGIFKLSQALSGLDTKSEDEAKNGSEETS